VTHQRLEELLRDAPLPDEDEARKRSWRVVRAAYEQRSAAGAPRRRNARLGLALAGAAAVLAIALSPAGAKVGDVIRDVTGIGGRKPEPALTSLPAPGRLLVDSPVGPWVVQGDGSKRLLGEYGAATWSPGGLYVGAVSSSELAAVDPQGTVRWTLDRPATIHDARWSRSGFRIAYRSGSSLRVIAGDGSGDHLVAGDAAPAPVAWEPLSRAGAGRVAQGLPVPELLAYAKTDGQIAVIDVDTGAVQWTARAPSHSIPRELVWSSDGKLLLAVSRKGLSTYEPARSRDPIAAGYGAAASISAATFIPGTHRIAAAVRVPSAPGRTVSEVRYGRADAKLFLSNRLLARRGPFTDLVPSPDGRWLLVAEPGADRWLFVRPADGRVKVATNISRQFDPGATGPVAFPRIDGWCCGS